MPDVPASSPFADSTHFDAELVARVRAGEMVAFEQIVGAHYTFLLSYVAHVVRSEAEASDILQDMFVQLWERRATWEVRGPLRPYLVGAASRRIASTMRGAYRAERRDQRYALTTGVVDDTVAPGADPLADTERAELSAAVERALDALPPKAREVWILRRLEGMTSAEVAAALGISENTVKTHLARGMATLRAHLGRFLSLTLVAVGQTFL